MSEMRGLLGAATLGLSPEFIISDQIHPCDQSSSRDGEVILPVNLLKLQSVLLKYVCTYRKAAPGKSARNVAKRRRVA